MASTPAAQTALGDSERVRARYAVLPPRRRPLALVATVCAVIAAIGFGWVAWGMLQPQAEGEVGRFHVVDATEVTLVLEVTRPEGRRAVCTIEALGAGFSQVGLLEVEVEPAETSVSQFPLSMATSAEATVATVRGCRLI